MALTPGNLPYPVGTDKVVDGDDAIHNLALKLDPVYTHALPVLGAGGSNVPLTTASDARWIYQGFRVAGTIEVVIAANALPAGGWLLQLPKIPKRPAGASMVLLGHGWIYPNGANITGAVLAQHSNDAGTLVAGIFINGGTLGGYAVAPAAGMFAQFTFSYETTVAA